MCQSLHPEFFLSCAPLAWLLSLLSCAYVFLLVTVGGRGTLLSDLCVPWSPLIDQGGHVSQNSFCLMSYSWGAEGVAFPTRWGPGFPTCLRVLSCLSHKSASFLKLFSSVMPVLAERVTVTQPAGSPFPPVPEWRLCVSVVCLRMVTALQHVK